MQSQCGRETNACGHHRPPTECEERGKAGQSSPAVQQLEGCEMPSRGRDKERNVRGGTQETRVQQQLCIKGEQIIEREWKVCMCVHLCVWVLSAIGRFPDTELVLCFFSLVTLSAKHKKTTTTASTGREKNLNFATSCALRGACSTFNLLNLAYG